MSVCSASVHRQALKCACGFASPPLYRPREIHCLKCALVLLAVCEQEPCAAMLRGRLVTHCACSSMAKLVVAGAAIPIDRPSQGGAHTRRAKSL